MVKYLLLSPQRDLDTLIRGGNLLLEALLHLGEGQTRLGRDFPKVHLIVLSVFVEKRFATHLLEGINDFLQRFFTLPSLKQFDGKENLGGSGTRHARLTNERVREACGQG